MLSRILHQAFQFSAKVLAVSYSSAKEFYEVNGKFFRFGAVARQASELNLFVEHRSHQVQILRGEDLGSSVVK
ncbi:hypothetical protein AOX55_00004025 [Sinorhizobium fredii CCBAU 25509]|nr:hypothetical protein AOX55_00004025 [Sinorhizobium fredii CCBAU 25509]